MPKPFTLFLLIVALIPISSHGQVPADSTGEAARPLWQPVELVFEAEPGEAHPVTVRFDVIFRQPGGAYRRIPGFWDGGAVWKVRLAPDSVGEWNWRTVCPDLPALDGHEGSFSAGPATGTRGPYRHGGFLRVSGNKRYLTWADGTPFFWLGDTLWTFPTDSTPLEPDPETGVSMLGTILQTRANQGYTVIQCGFIRDNTGNLDINDPRSWKSGDMDFWRRADARIEAAAEAGLVMAMTSNWWRQVYDYPLDSLMLKWRYLVARYAAYPVTWIVSGEYNQRAFADQTVDKVMVLGTWIKGLDPYKRAMTVHPWAIQVDDRQAWDAEWNDFIMLQGGHRLTPSAFAYLEAYLRADPKPVLESECDYEGMFEERSKDDLVRHVAYRSIQNGSFGFTYGALGLWNAAPEPGDPGKWGLPTSWQEALAFPGGEQMGHLRRAYESVDWWELEPRPMSAWPNEHARVHVKAIGNDVFMLYFESGLDAALEVRLSPKAGSGRLWGKFSAEWFDPRTGERTLWKDGAPLGQNWAGDLVLPARPDPQDWLLIIRRLKDIAGS